LVELANNQNVSRYLIYTFPFPYTRKDANWWIETGAHQQGAQTKVIEYQGTFVGSVGINPQTGWRSHIAEIGYWIGEEFWGKGLASEALRQMTELSFSQGNFEKLIAPVLGPNRASMKVLEKNGYELEAVLKAEVVKNGQPYDHHIYAKHRT
jgi:RimJ/RimL family protein N-acetyltransferase